MTSISRRGWYLPPTPPTPNSDSRTRIVLQLRLRGGLVEWGEKKQKKRSNPRPFPSRRPGALPSANPSSTPSNPRPGAVVPCRAADPPVRDGPNQVSPFLIDIICLLGPKKLPANTEASILHTQALPNWIPASPLPRLLPSLCACCCRNHLQSLP